MQPTHVRLAAERADRLFTGYAGKAMALNACADEETLVYALEMAQKNVLRYAEQKARASGRDTPVQPGVFLRSINRELKKYNFKTIGE